MVVQQSTALLVAVWVVFIGFVIPVVFMIPVVFVQHRGEIGKGCDCNTCRGDHTWNMFGASLHMNYCKWSVALQWWHPLRKPSLSKLPKSWKTGFEEVCRMKRRKTRKTRTAKTRKMWIGLRSENPECGNGHMWDLGHREDTQRPPAWNNAPGGSTACATRAWRKHALLSSETRWYRVEKTRPKEKQTGYFGSTVRSICAL